MELPVFDHDERFAELSPDHRVALARAIEFIVDRYEPRGILVAGTIIRGEGHTNSDLDVAVIHDQPWRQRVQRFENDVPVEIFVNPRFQWEKTFAAEARSGQPSMLGIVSTGIPVYATDSTLAELISHAHRLYAAGPQLTAEQLTNLRYALVTQFEDAVDIETEDLDRSNAYIINSLLQTARLSLLQSGEWLPREKQLFDRLDTREPELGKDLRAIFAAPRTSWVGLAGPLIERVAGTARFFAWESTPQPVAE
jgi:hypothetical protein